MLAARKVVTMLFLFSSVTAYAGGTYVVIDRGEHAGSLEIRIGIPREDGEPKWIEARRLATESSFEIPSLGMPGRRSPCRSDRTTFRPVIP